MAYIVPAMPLGVNVWLPPAVFPPVGLPSVVTVGNLSPGRRVAAAYRTGQDEVFVLLPALTDVRIGGVVEVPAGSGRYYKVASVDDLGKGFANEHRYAAIVADYASWPVPYP
jgi:hypothetical protein